MNGILKTLVFSFLVLINFSETNACSKNQLRQITYDSSDVMFVGKITGFVGPIESAKIRNQLYGLEIELINSIYFPYGKGIFQVFPLSVSSDCKPTSYELNDLESYYPLGSEIRIIGSSFSRIDSTLSKDEDGKNRIVCFLLLGEHWPSIKYDHPFFEEQELIDFKNLDKMKKELEEYISNHPDSTNSLMIWSFGSLKYWYFLKGLYNLNSAKSEDEKYAILSKIIYFYYTEHRAQQVAEHYIKSKKKQKKLLKLYKENHKNL